MLIRMLVYNITKILYVFNLVPNMNVELVLPYFDHVLLRLMYAYFFFFSCLRILLCSKPLD